MPLRFQIAASLRARPVVKGRRSIVWLFVLFLGLSATGKALGQAPSVEAGLPAAERQTTYLIVRHADRDGDQDRLTAAGHTRAQALCELGTLLNVTALYSTDFERTRSTAQPLAKARGLNLELYDQPSAEWIASMRQANSGGVVLIVGHSNTIGLIASQLAGVPVPEIGHGEYDHLYVVTDQKGLSPSLVRLKYGSNGQAGQPPKAPDQ